ncbi:MAG TPA: TRZ/ATZ family protein [Candidatus Omnitrophica bacterium]|nr:TRZ/ATZ family protein [Candidatus Omnitrophota bacterium]
MKKIKLPLDKGRIKNLKAGEELLLSGLIYTARDQAHKKLVEAIKKGRKLPFALKNAIIYYCGPTPARKGRVIGSCGPTTSSRMDDFTPALLRCGLSAMIGKGSRDESVVGAIKKYKAVYFIAFSGCGAFASRFVKKRKLVAYPELGTEAIQALEVRDFPVIVGIDCYGRNILERKK